MIQLFTRLPRPGGVAILLWFAGMAVLLGFMDDTRSYTPVFVGSVMTACICVAMAWSTRLRSWRLASIVAVWWVAIPVVLSLVTTAQTGH